MGGDRRRSVRRQLRREAARHADQRARDGGLRHEGQVHHPQAEEGAQLQAHGRRGVDGGGDGLEQQTLRVLQGEEEEIGSATLASGERNSTQIIHAAPPKTIPQCL